VGPSSDSIWGCASGIHCRDLPAPRGAADETQARGTATVLVTADDHGPAISGLRGRVGLRTVAAAMRPDQSQSEPGHGEQPTRSLIIRGNSR